MKSLIELHNNIVNRIQHYGQNIDVKIYFTLLPLKIDKNDLCFPQKNVQYLRGKINNLRNEVL